MRHFKHIAAALFVAMIIASGARALYATRGQDFVQGQLIPAALRGSHYFEPDVKSASFTVDAEDTMYFITSAGGAITATLPAPSTMPTGKCWGAILTTAGNAVTFNAAPFSINGAVTDANMDAAGDSYVVCNNGAGYFLLSRYIH